MDFILKKKRYNGNKKFGKKKINKNYIKKDKSTQCHENKNDFIEKCYFKNILKFIYK
jgi:hypothetical protein